MYTGNFYIIKGVVKRHCTICCADIGWWVAPIQRCEVAEMWGKFDTWLHECVVLPLSPKSRYRNQSEAEILNGLGNEEIVVLHPSNQLDDGMRVRGY